ncbi:HNH endonuclease [Streptomyces sp. NPDC048305]|uniref:HNH endonuclease n=1 Tax=Streptomyces sp. NPDC048305 TaxID=3365532 RepID=UPI003717F1DC
MKCIVTSSAGAECKNDAKNQVLKLCWTHSDRLLRWGHVGKDTPIRSYTPSENKADPIRGEGDTDEERFYSRVQKTGDHWWWEGSVMNSGYGQCGHEGYNQTAARVAWQLHFGALPEKVKVVPVCGEKLCVRLSHLEVRHLGGQPYFEFSPAELAESVGVAA